MSWASGRGNLQFNSPAIEQLYWWPVKSAADLLISPEIKQLKECPACGWLFLDKSKNQSRKWCSMSTCGDISKVTRNYQRNKRKKND
jgi:predicted RNA-binding Zn ribbon-like protein